MFGFVLIEDWLEILMNGMMSGQSFKWFDSLKFRK